MLKNGNFDTKSSLYKSYTLKPLKKSFLLPQMVVSKKKQESNFLCFGPGCMNRPLVYHNWSTTTLGNNNNGVVVTSSSAQVSLAGRFYGTYDVEESSSSNVMTSHDATAATTSATNNTGKYISCIISTPTKFNHPLFQWTTIRPPSQRNRMQRSSHIKVLNFSIQNITGATIHHLPSFPLPTD